MTNQPIGSNGGSSSSELRIFWEAQRRRGEAIAKDGRSEIEEKIVVLQEKARKNVEAAAKELEKTIRGMWEAAVRRGGIVDKSALERDTQILKNSFDTYVAQVRREAEEEAQVLVACVTSRCEFEVSQRMSELFDPSAAFCNYTLPPEIRRTFFSDGYCVLTSCISPALRLATLTVINHEIGQGRCLEETMMSKESSTGNQRCQAECSRPLLQLLTDSPALAACRDLLGMTKPVYGGQIAPRFPGFQCIPLDLTNDRPHVLQPLLNWEHHWHIDGFQNAGELHSFCLLVGVFLNDLPDCLSGNFTVFPGSHIELQQYFTRQGDEGVKRIVQRGFRHAAEVTLSATAVPLVVQAGDVVICHYQLAHTIAPNCSPNVRYAVFFRLSSQDALEASLQEQCRRLQAIWKYYK